MKVVVAIDSLKGSLTSLEAGRAIETGIHRAMPEAEVTVRPLADGGEGTARALTLGMGGRLVKVRVTGPLGEPVLAEYGIIDDSRTAVIEMASAAGITLISETDRNPMETTTYGVGEMIRDALEKGCRNFIVGIGGSATNDGGIGMLQALGYELLDAEGSQAAFGAKGLKGIEQIRDFNVPAALKESRFSVACDVNNPLCGPRGCSAVFGPQKGATPDMVSQMDDWLWSFAEITVRKYPGADMNYPGTGAAGGLGFAFRTFLGASLESGVGIVLSQTRLAEYIKDADIVVTGEGRLDGQTVMGKAPIGVASLAKKYGKKVIAFAGSVAADASACNEHGIDAFFPILRGVSTLDEAMERENALRNMTDSVEQVFRLIDVVGASKGMGAE